MKKLTYDPIPLSIIRFDKGTIYVSTLQSINAQIDRKEIIIINILPDK